MYTVVRPYFGKGAKELFDVLEKNTTDVEKTLRSVTVCNDKTGTDENLEKARDWIREERRRQWRAAPKVSEGSVVFDLK